MKNKFLMFTIVGLVFGGVLVFIFPSIKAQITKNQVIQNDDALELVKSQPISNTFYEGLMADDAFKSSDLKLTKAFFKKKSQEENTLKTSDFEEWYMMEFQNEGTKAVISIYEYESSAMASKVLNTLWHSQGKVSQFKTFGDEGLKGFDNSGKLMGIRFRKGRFVIYVSSGSNELIASFAENALKSI